MTKLDWTEFKTKHTEKSEQSWSNRSECTKRNRPEKGDTKENMEWGSEKCNWDESMREKYSKTEKVGRFLEEKITEHNWLIYLFLSAIVHCWDCQPKLNFTLPDLGEPRRRKLIHITQSRKLKIPPVTIFYFFLIFIFYN